MLIVFNAKFLKKMFNARFGKRYFDERRWKTPINSQKKNVPSCRVRVATMTHDHDDTPLLFLILGLFDLLKLTRN